MEDYPGTLLEFEERFNTEEACRRYFTDIALARGVSVPGLWGNQVLDDER
jgi:hypothetical protein